MNKHRCQNLIAVGFLCYSTKSCNSATETTHWNWSHNSGSRCVCVCVCVRLRVYVCVVCMCVCVVCCVFGLCTIILLIITVMIYFVRFYHYTYNIVLEFSCRL